jgi:hypothetical protein
MGVANFMVHAPQGFFWVKNRGDLIAPYRFMSLEVSE